MSTAEFVIGAYYQLFEIEKASGWPRASCGPGSFTTTLRDSIEAHLTIELAALAVGHWIERQTGW